MLSFNVNITNLRELCKALTGRTSSTAIARINRLLADYRPEYIVKIVGTQRAPSISGTRPVTAINFEVTTPSGQRIQSDRLTLPISYAGLIEKLTSLDARAEQFLNLGYGAARATGRPTRTMNGT